MPDSEGLRKRCESPYILNFALKVSKNMFQYKSESLFRVQRYSVLTKF